MLTIEEQKAREQFYIGKFGRDWVNRNITIRPTLFPITSYDEKLKGLSERGFKDPIKMITSFNPILGLSFENIDEKLKGLSERGFKDPIKMITSFPHILGLSFESLDEKVKGLSERGFKDPIKMITSFTHILSLSFENIDEKVKGLPERGFKDPIKTIASFPSILGFSLKNIDKKLKKARRLKACVDDFIAYTVLFIGMSSKHYIPLIRACRKQGKEVTPRNIFAIYRAKSFI